MGRKQQQSGRRRGDKAKPAPDPAAAQRAAAAGRTAFDAQRYEVAARHFAEAVELDPSSASHRAGLAHSLGMRQDFAGVERELAALLETSGRSADSHRLAGETWERLGKHRESASQYERAAERDPQNLELLVALARAAERCHDLGRAREVLGRAIRLEPDLPGARLLTARLERRDGDLDRAAATLEGLLREPEPAGAAARAVQVEAGYEAAHVADARGEYAVAMQRLRSAKQLQEQDDAATPLAAAMRQETTTRLLFATLTSVHVERWLAAAADVHPRRRIAALTGHPRSGTTLLEQILDGHDDVISADESTVLASTVADGMLAAPAPSNRIDDSQLVAHVDSVPTGRIAGLRGDYWSAISRFLGTKIGERLLLDKNPELVRLLPFGLRAFPELKLLIALRDPRDVCLSCYMQHLPLNPVSVNWLSLERTVGRYATLMSGWRSLRGMLPKSHWLEVRYEDLVQNPAEQAERTLEFLELDRSDGVLDRTLDHTARAKAKAIDNPSYAAVTQPIHRGAVGRWENYAEFFAPLEGKLAPLLKTFGYANS